MQEPPIPSDEAERLEVLRALDLVDTTGEERFDAVTRIAKRLFDTSMAMVTLVASDRQWFKSNQGMVIDEGPRHLSFCGHAILSDSPLVIPDAQKDPRFADNPYVSGNPWIRFYAGVPLVVQGRAVGTLCVLDPNPRQFEDVDRRSLEDLAGIVAREMATMEMATIDELTGLANRRGFLSLADQSLRVAEREGLPTSLVFFDINGLKAINDSLGHSAGDAAIRAIATRMSETFRAADIVARLSGDEFVVLLHNTSAEQAPRSIERLKANLYQAECNELTLPSLAYGIVTYDPDHHGDIQSLLRDADSRMYENKQDGRESGIAGSERL